MRADGGNRDHVLYSSRQDSVGMNNSIDGSVELMLGKLAERTENNAKAIEMLGT